MLEPKWLRIGGAVDRAMYSTDSASSELVPTVAEKAAHIFVSFSSNRGTAAPGMLPPADSFEPANKSHIAHIYAGWGALSDRSALAPSGRGVPLGDPTVFHPSGKVLRNEVVPDESPGVADA